MAASTPLSFALGLPVKPKENVTIFPLTTKDGAPLEIVSTIALRKNFLGKGYNDRARDITLAKEVILCLRESSAGANELFQQLDALAEAVTQTVIAVCAEGVDLKAGIPSIVTRDASLDGVYPGKVSLSLTRAGAWKFRMFDSKKAPVADGLILPMLTTGDEFKFSAVIESVWVTEKSAGFNVVVQQLMCVKDGVKDALSAIPAKAVF